ncbi:hypothetical protein ACLK1S_25905 [Escherichia coli]
MSAIIAPVMILLVGICRHWGCFRVIRWLRARSGVRAELHWSRIPCS